MDQKRNHLSDALRKPVVTVLRFSGKEPTPDAVETGVQFAGFLLVGLTGTAVQFALYALLLALFGERYLLVWNTVAYAAAVADMIFLNSRFVFTDGQTGKSAKLRSALCYVATYAVQQGVLWLLTSVLHLPEFFALLPAMLLSCLLNFVLNKCFAYKA